MRRISPAFGEIRNFYILFIDIHFFFPDTFSLFVFISLVTSIYFNGMVKLLSCDTHIVFLYISVMTDDGSWIIASIKLFDIRLFFLQFSSCEVIPTRSRLYEGWSDYVVFLWRKKSEQWTSVSLQLSFSSWLLKWRFPVLSYAWSVNHLIILLHSVHKVNEDVVQQLHVELMNHCLMFLYQSTRTWPSLQTMRRLSSKELYIVALCLFRPIVDFLINCVTQEVISIRYDVGEFIMTVSWY